MKAVFKRLVRCIFGHDGYLEGLHVAHEPSWWQRYKAWRGASVTKKISVYDLDLVVETTFQELVSKSTSGQQFQAPPVENAFESWWRDKRDRKSNAKNLAKAAWNEALRLMGAFDK